MPKLEFRGPRTLLKLLGAGTLMCAAWFAPAAAQKSARISEYDSLVAEARRLDGEKQYQQAWDRYWEAYNLATRIPDPERGLETAETMYEFAESRNFFHGVIVAWKMKADSYRALGRLADAGWVHVDIAKSLREAGRLGQAEESRQAAVELGLQAQDDRLLAMALHEMGIAEVSMGGYGDAEAILLDVKRRFEALNDREMILETLSYLATAAHGLGKLKDSKRYLDESLEIGKSLGNAEPTPAQLWNLSRIEEELGNHQEALGYLRQSLKMEKADGNEAGVAVDLGSIGRLLLEIGQLDEAESYIRQSLAINEELNRTSGMAYQYQNLGAVSLERGETATACGHFEKAAGLFTEAGDLSAVDSLREIQAAHCE